MVIVDYDRWLSAHLIPGTGGAFPRGSGARRASCGSGGDCAVGEVGRIRRGASV